MHFGIISPPVPGHIHPFGALGRELLRRGHRVSLIQMPDVASKALAEGLEFIPVGQTDHPRGALPESLERLGRLKGLAALRFTINAVRKTTIMMCRDAPEVIRGAGIEMLLVDQTEPAGGTVAERLDLPFVTVCCALALNRESGAPPPFTAWKPSSAGWALLRNRLGYAASAQIMRPVARALDDFRSGWRLPRLREPEDSFSRLAQISQQPPAFDFPRASLPSSFHYVGPFRDDGASTVLFPWERLDPRRPLVYASLGTLQHQKTGLFHAFAEACAGLDVQLVLAHCGALEKRAVAALPGEPVAVHYAPQTDVLARAALALTHAGLNTVLDALSFGVPMVALPITYEQPAIAARVEWCGAGCAVNLRKLSASTLRSAISRILADPAYAESASRVAHSIRRAGGVRRAADIVEHCAERHRALRTGTPVI